MNKNAWMTTNVVLLGLTMLIPGVLKLLGSSGVVGMMSGNPLFSWAPTLWAWILIIAEIAIGIAILARYKADIAAYGAAIILLIATLTVHIKWGDLGAISWSNVLIHLTVVSNYVVFAMSKKGKK